MPTLKLTNLASYKAYFAAIANAHKEIDGFKWGDKDVVRNDNRSDMPARVLWATPYESARYNDLFSDNVQKTKVARVAYFKVANTLTFEQEDVVFEECEAVIEQIIAKMKLDKAGYAISGGWEMIVMNVGAVTTGPVEMKIGSTKYIGWEMNIPFNDNANLEYDASKWN